jgi:hypothetical protein
MSEDTKPNDALSPLKDALKALIKLLDSFKQPLTELIAVRDQMIEVRKNLEPGYLKFMQDELAPELTKRLHKVAPKDDKVNTIFSFLVC